MKPEMLWQEFCEKNHIDVNNNYLVWPFGGAPDYLAALVTQGIKTATASGYDLYFLENNEFPFPQVGDYHVILDSKDRAVCVLQTVNVDVVPFNLVGEEQAYKEGEGDRSLAYWRRVHDEFFQEDFANYGIEFTHESKIVCEEFKLLHSVYGVVPFEEKDAKEICDWKYEGEYSVYNQPSWNQCVLNEVAFTKEDIRRNEYYKVLKYSAFLGFFRVHDSETCITLELGIHPDQCGKQNGDILFSLALAKISEYHPGKKITMNVHAFNQRAIKVFEKRHFQVIGEYQDNQSSILVMEANSR